MESAAVELVVDLQIGRLQYVESVLVALVIHLSTTFEGTLHLCPDVGGEADIEPAIVLCA